MKEFLFQNCFSIVGVGLLMFIVFVVWYIAKPLIEASNAFINNQIEEDEPEYTLINEDKHLSINVIGEIIVFPELED